MINNDNDFRKSICSNLYQRFVSRNISSIEKGEKSIPTLIDFNIEFQPFGEETSAVHLVIFLLFGFCGFLLIILLCSDVFITLVEEDTIVLLDTEDEDSEEMNNVETEENADHVSKTLKVVKQSEKLPNKLFSTAQQGNTLFCNVFHLFVKLPLLLHSYYVHWRQEIDNDFISI